MSLIGALVVPFPAASDTDADAASAKLTGSSSREWVLTQVNTIMGTGGCTQGEVYRFGKGGGLTIERCIGGQMKPVETHRWHVGRESAIDLILDIDGTRRRILFREAGAKIEMLLRHTASGKADPSEDKIFRYERD